jgi:protein-L-isoaspartate(D-aspartate) O-methyltransferase
MPSAPLFLEKPAMEKKTLSFILSFLILGIVFEAPWASSRQGPGDGEEKDRFVIMRKTMVDEQIASPRSYRRPVHDKKVLEAMETVPRHRFVPDRYLGQAYGDHPIPIGYGQTISQPYIVALMTELLDLDPNHRVLEIGTGSAYQAAILAHLVQHVYTIEIVKPLSLEAASRLRALGYDNVDVIFGDGYFGWEERAPYDRIIVTCASALIPPPLIQQLVRGGKMCIPIGGPYAVQQLTLVEKDEDGKITMKKVLPVRFVPLTRSPR